MPAPDSALTCPILGAWGQIELHGNHAEPRVRSKQRFNAWLLALEAKCTTHWSGCANPDFRSPMELVSLVFMWA
jgi:hypothetical protein